LPGLEVVVVAAHELGEAAAVHLDDLAHHAIQEVPVVRDDDEGSLPAVEKPLQPIDGRKVEVIRRLVEQEEIGRRKQQARESDPHPPPARQCLQRLVEARLRDSQSRQDRPRPRFDLVTPHRLEAVAELAVRGRELLDLRVSRAQRGEFVLQLLQPLLHLADLGEAVEHGREHAAGSKRLDLLGQVADTNAPRAVDGPCVLSVLAGQDAQQRRLPRAVGADQPPARALRDQKAQPFENDARAELALELVDVNHPGTSSQRSRNRRAESGAKPA
jgi:hypothetical protein